MCKELKDIIERVSNLTGLQINRRDESIFFLMAYLHRAVESAEVLLKAEDVQSRQKLISIEQEKNTKLLSQIQTLVDCLQLQGNKPEE